MATVTKFVAYMEDGKVQAGYDYDDAAASPRVLRAFAINNATGQMRLTARRVSDGAVFAVDCEPGFARERTFNNSAAQRLALDLTEPSVPRMNGFTLEVAYWGGA